MKELVVISGKGGTGKTSLVASFASLAKNCVLADCDVDAADLHLILEPAIKERRNFSGGKRAEIITDECSGCGTCIQVCKFDAITFAESEYRIDPIACEGCGVCDHFCPEKAISFKPAINGEWYLSETKFGPMVHAKLGIAEENSGKLVTTVREEAGKLAKKQNRELVLVDGSPGIGCPVIASLTGANVALIVTEPTLSGLHDLKRVAALVKHFGLSGAVCINKWDLNPDVSTQIETLAAELGFLMAGKIRYDVTVTAAQIERLPVVQYTQDGCSQDVHAVWQVIRDILK